MEGELVVKAVWWKTWHRMSDRVKIIDGIEYPLTACGLVYISWTTHCKSLNRVTTEKLCDKCRSAHRSE